MKPRFILIAGAIIIAVVAYINIIYEQVVRVTWPDGRSEIYHGATVNDRLLGPPAIVLDDGTTIVVSNGKIEKWRELRN